MIYVEPRAGLCNRMRVIASAYSLASKYDTQITILWRVSKGLNCSYYDLFCADPRICVIESRHKISLHFLSKVFRCKKIFINARIDIAEDVEKLIEKNKNIYVSTVFPFYSIDNYEMFVPINQIVSKVDKIIENYKCNIIGIHIRRTDNVEAIRYSPLKMFDDFINKEISNNSGIKFYLATDSEETENTLIGKYKEHIINNSNKVWNRNTPEGIKDALIDLCCLSRCSTLVGSYYSSFTDTAAQWGKEKEVYILTNKSS